jgi:hypothetical protein
MALARCKGCGPPKGRKGNTYVSSHLPQSSPNSGVVCGYSVCNDEALVWLTEKEEKQYQKGERVFEFPTQAVKVRVT